MKSSRGIKSILIAAVSVMIIAGWALAADITFVGEVNDNYQIVADGQIYEIADTQKGNELVDKYISYRVEVSGTVEEVDDMKILTVVSYKLLSD